MTKCAYRMFGGGSTRVLAVELVASGAGPDWQGPENDPAAIIAQRLACLPRMPEPARQIVEALLADRYLAAIDTPCVRVSGSLRAETRFIGDPVAPLLAPPPAFTQFSACPYLKLRISTSGSTVGQWIIDADSALTIPAAHVCVELLRPATGTSIGPWADPTSVPNIFTGEIVTNAWDVQGAVKICRTCDSGPERGTGRLTEFFTATAGLSFDVVRPRGARRVWFGAQPMLQVWRLFAGDPAAGGLQVGEARIPIDSVEALELFPGVSHIQNAAFPSDRQVVFSWEITPP